MGKYDLQNTHISVSLSLSLSLSLTLVLELGLKITSDGPAFQSGITVNYRLNALGVYLKIQNFKRAFIREGRLIKRGVYFKMHKFRKQT